VLASGLALGAATNQVLRGMTQGEVAAILGTPSGQMATGQRTIWTYRQGLVEFVNGRVASSTLLSEAELARKGAELAAQRRAATNAAVTAAVRPAAAKPPSVAERPAAVQAPAGELPYLCPFIRPPFEGAQYYGEIPVVFEMRHWPPQMRQIFNESVEIPVSTGQRRTTYQTLVYELRKYPPPMLDRTIRCIYVIRNLKGEGKDPAGYAFYTEGIVIEHTSYVHHEIAHQFHAQFADAFPAEALQALSGGYLGLGHSEALPFKALCELGFVSDYGRSNVYEDFAEFCEKLYLQPEYMFRLIAEYPKLQAKYDLVRPFLEMIKRRTTGDTTPMDRDYFQRFDRSRWKPGP
jgi:hypothetical protein